MYHYLWSNGQTTAEITGLPVGEYKVTVTDINGCSTADSILLEPARQVCVGIPNTFSPDGDGYNEYWSISRISLYPDAEVIVMNRWGQVVWRSERGYPVPWDGRGTDGKILPMDSYHYAIDLNNGDKPIVGHVTIVR